MSAKSHADPTRPKISFERAGRLYKLLALIGDGPVGRPQILRALKVGMRTFYRDVDLLRETGVHINTSSSAYVLGDTLSDALDLVPFPDPELTFGDVLLLMKGRSKSHQKLKRLFAQITR